MIALTWEHYECFGKIAEKETRVRELAPCHSHYHLIVRLLPETDLATPGGMQVSNLLLHLAYSSSGRVESTVNLAAIASAKDSPEAFRK